MFARARRLIEQIRSRDRGAALITVLLFVVLVFILITAMLSVTGNEIVIASLQRDGVRASELAQAGIQEAIRRVEMGRPFSVPFTSVLDSRVNVTVTRVFTGSNSAYLEITATASNVGAATRKLTALVLQQIIAFPPDITFAASVSESGSAAITCGDAYARSFIQYKSYPTNACAPPQTITYAGWRVSKTPGSGPAVAPCYTHLGCTTANPGNPDVANWYPGTRLGVSETTAAGQDILAFQANAEANGCAVLPPYNTTVPTGAILQTNVTLAAPIDQYGFDPDDPSGTVPSQLDPDLFPCGLPFKWVSQGPADNPPFLDENGAFVPGGNPPNTRWFKTIVFEEWFDNYWRFDEAKMTAVKRGNGLGTAACIDSICVKANAADPDPTVQPDLQRYPEYGAVPPFPETSSVTNNYDCSKTGIGTLPSLPTACNRIDGTPAPTDHMGCKKPEMTAAYCTQTEQKVFVLNGDWTVNGNIGGHGTLVVNGNLIVNGTFDYWGTIIVNGTLQAGTGAVNIHGGLVAQSTLQLIGNISVEGGGTVTNVPTGHSLVIGKAWWER